MAEETIYDKIKKAVREVTYELGSQGEGPDADTPDQAYRLVEPGETLTITLTITRTNAEDDHGPQS